MAQNPISGVRRFRAGGARRSLHDLASLISTMSLFADKNALNPFKLRSRELRPRDQVARTRHEEARHTASVAFFPWTATNSTGLWNGYVGNPTIREHWSRLVKDYRGVYAVAVRRTVRILSVASEAKNIVHTVELDQVIFMLRQTSIYRLLIHLQHESYDEDIPFEQANSIRAIAWAIDPNTVPFRPLLLIAASSVLHVYDVTRQCSVGTVKGHGGACATHSTSQPPGWLTDRRGSAQVKSLPLLSFLHSHSSPSQHHGILPHVSMISL